MVKFEMIDFIPRNIGKYEIQKKLGSGNFSTVYLARDTALDAIKAIKVIDVKDPESIMQKLEEAQLSYKCQHKYIVKINSATSLKNETGLFQIILDMEYIRNGSIEDYMKNNFVSVVEAVKYIREVLFGLEHAHCNGVLHHDIKPGNIMLDKTGAKLADFGLAALIKKDPKEFEYGYYPHYAPERLLQKKGSIETDIYAMGLTFFRIVCNFKKSDWESHKKHKEYYNKIKEGKIVEFVGFTPHIPRRIKRIINKASHADYRKRFHSAGEMNQALTALKPHIDWKMINKDIWQGESTDGSSYKIFLFKERKFKVDLKRNNRRITKDCKIFDNEKKAWRYFYKYISQTTFK